MEHAVSVLKISSAMARHAADAHRVTARNIAHADIPGASRMQVELFQRGLKRLEDGDALRAETIREPIDIEAEMLAMAKAGGRHEAAVRIWRSTLDMMRLAASGPRS